MKLIIILLCMTFKAYGQLSYGDGSETCNWTTSSKSQRIYNCSSVNVSGGQTINFNGASDYIIIRSQGDVTIDGTLSLSAVGTTPGPGGTAGGSCPVGTCNGVNGTSNNGGQGLGGQNAVNGGAGVSAAGGGGSGARFGTAVLPTAGTSGGTSGGTAGTGAAIPAAGYFPESDFVSNFTGGAGGGAGGSGDDGILAEESGGTGGAGGGGVIIIAKGIVTISGSVLSNGSNGSNGSAGGGSGGGGGGGGGSGGAIYIIGAQGVNITGTVSAINGNGGSGGISVDTGGAGGNGGSGRIRVDSLSGTYTGAVTNPLAFQSTIPSIMDPILGDGLRLESDIEYSCSYKIANEYGFLYQFFMGILLGLGLLQIPKVFHRLRY